MRPPAAASTNIGATLILDRTTFEGNTADQGGAINNNSGGILTVTNSTFANNRAQVGGAIITYNQATITATTISGNGATDRSAAASSAPTGR